MIPLTALRCSNTKTQIPSKAEVESVDQFGPLQTARCLWNYTGSNEHKKSCMILVESTVQHIGWSTVQHMIYFIYTHQSCLLWAMIFACHGKCSLQCFCREIRCELRSRFWYTRTCKKWVGKAISASDYQSHQSYQKFCKTHFIFHILRYIYTHVQLWNSVICNYSVRPLKNATCHITSSS